MSTNSDSVFSHMYSLPRNVGQFRPWTIQTFSVDSLDPLDNSDLDHWSIRTSTNGQFGPQPLVNSDFNFPFCLLLVILN